MATITVTDREMEQVYRYVSTMGHQRAIEEVAGTRYDEATDTFVPFTELQAALRARYDNEMAEFIEAGGY